MLNTGNNYRTSKVVLILCGIVMVWISANLNWGRESWRDIIAADGKGYYAYNPAVFIYQDPNFSFFDSLDSKKYYNPNLFYDYRIGIEGEVVNKYYCGTAVLQAPFFLMAHGITLLTGGDMDGYSKWSPIMVSVAALFYMLLGLLYLFKTLQLLEVPDLTSAFILLTTLFATHLFYYTIGEPSMSHVFSFGLINVFIYGVISTNKRFKSSWILLLGFILGLIFLVRPVNVLVVFGIPFLLGSKEQFIVLFQNLWKTKKVTVWAMLIALAVVCIQLLYYKWATGNFLIYSYGEEGFNFLEPAFVDILFSYKKGLFVYTPILLIALIGALFIQSRWTKIAFLLFFLLLTYVFSSWWMWYYGGSFSSRVYVEFIPFFMIAFAMGLKAMNSIHLKRVFYLVGLILLVVCQIQTYQYRYFIIHWADMNQQKYWDVFLRVDQLF